jgi:hypothetical protein
MLPALLATVQMSTKLGSLGVVEGAERVGGKLVAVAVPGGARVPGAHR